MSPCTRGIRGFICAMTMDAFSIASMQMSTLMPRLTYPFWSGSDVWMRATSIGIILLRNSCGIRDRNMGV